MHRPPLFSELGGSPVGCEPEVFEYGYPAVAVDLDAAPQPALLHHRERAGAAGTRRRGPLPAGTRWRGSSVRGGGGV